MAAVVSIRGADRINALLRDLPKLVTQGKTGGVVAKSLRKGARVIVNQEKITLQQAIDVGQVYSTGELVKKITVKRKKYMGKGERMMITLRKGVYKSRAGGVARSEKATLSYYAAGLMLEHGSSKQPATPWVRPAFLAKSQEAFDVINDHLLSSLEKLAQTHLPQEQ